MVGVAIDHPTRTSHVQRKLLAPLAGIDPDGGFLFAEECLLPEREQNRSLVLRRMVEDVGVLIVGLWYTSRNNRRKVKETIINVVCI